MTSKGKLLLLEILALEARYSPKDVREVERLLLHGEGSEEARRILQLVRKASTDDKIANPPYERSNHQLLKAKLSAGLRSASSARLNQFADMVGVVPADTKNETLRIIRERLKSLSPQELEAYDAKPVKDTGVDQGFVRLADFILNGPDRKDKE